ncbi:MAG: hypothetical protein U1E36_07360 [Rickettsiales bacterium]
MTAYTFAPIQTDPAQAAIRMPLGDAPVVYKEQNGSQRTKSLNEIVAEALEQNASTPESVQAILVKRMATHRAFIQAFDPNGVFTQAFATIYRHAHDDAISPEIALQEAQSYVINRRDEQVAALAQMENPAFMQDVLKALASGYQPAAETHGISPEKRKVLIDELVQLNGLNGKEPAIHIHDTARGHVAGHIALAKTLDPQGPLASVLSGVLMPLTPHLQPEEISRASYKFLEHFDRLAVEVADALQPNGEIVQEAIRQSEDKRQSEGVVLRMMQENEKPHQAYERRTPTTIVSWMQALGSLFPAFSQSRAS